MERTVLKELIEWKERADRKPLILNGARQVGKTWLLHEFARLEYKKEAYVVCRKNNLARQLFTQDFDVERILRGLRAMTSVDITPDDTLVILDEVQDIPEVLEALKYFKEEAPDYHIAVAGSLLGISLHENISYPVGKVNVINLYPMSFEEFLMAKGEKEACKLLMSRDYVMMSLLHEKYVDLLRQYYYVGGMPEAVSKYVETGALREVRRIQQEILQGYDLDFSKHAPKEQVPRIRMVWNSVPSQLFKENKKFIYKVVKEGARAREYEDALQWLVDARLVHKIYRSTAPGLPVAAYDDLSAFKIYLVDVGLLRRLAQLAPTAFGEGNRLFTEFKGALTENFVLQTLITQFEVVPRYWSQNNPPYEVDFLIQRENDIFPVEVKSEANTTSKSLKKFKELFPDQVKLRVRFSLDNLKLDDDVLNIPLFMADQADRLIGLALEKKNSFGQ